MRNTMITGLAVAGVVAAGAAAAAVNTTIFDGPPASATAATDIITPASTVQPAHNAANEQVVVQVATQTEAAGSTPATASPATVSMLTQYQVGDAGTVTLDVVDGLLAVVDSQANPGWTIEQVEEEGDEVEVMFLSADTEVEFEAALVAGSIETYVDSAPIDTTAPATYSEYEEQEEDDNEEEEYEDD